MTSPTNPSSPKRPASDDPANPPAEPGAPPPRFKSQVPGQPELPTPPPEPEPEIEEPADPNAPPPKKPGEDDAPHIKVRATQLGYYDDKRRRIGDVFTISLRRNAKGQFVEFSDKWMTRVRDDTPESLTTGRQELRKQHDEILAGKQGARPLGEPTTRTPLE